MKILKSAALALFATTLAFAQGGSEYFDCWQETFDNISSLEQKHFGLNKDQALCGCFKIDESSKQVTRVWNIPKPRTIACPDGNCQDAEHFRQCLDHIRQGVFKLTDLAKGGSIEGAVALTYDDGWSPTPFAEYVNQRKDRLADIDCFVEVHKRPGNDKDDWKDPSIFHVTGLPKILIPEAIGRTPDYSDFRCLDKGELTGFAYNGVVENLRHVDKSGNLSGEEIGYMNDPAYPRKKQGEKWGAVAWKANYKRGLRDGIATIYKSSVADNSDREYYFKHLEVNYKQGHVDGTTKMFSDKGVLMAEIPMKRGVIHGRMTVRNPFKKKNVPLNFVGGKLEGFNDFADFGGVFHEGLPNGLITYWMVKDTCYEWMPGAVVCHTERLKKRQWGSYKMGKFQGVMECWNGTKGDASVICPNPPLDTVAVDTTKQDTAIAAEPAVANASPTVAEPAKVEPPSGPSPQEIAAEEAREKAVAARAQAKAAKEKAKQAHLEAAKADKDAKRAEADAVRAEKAAKAAAKKAELAAKKSAKAKK